MVVYEVVVLLLQWQSKRWPSAVVDVLASRQGRSWLPIRGESGVKTLKACNPREWLAVFRDDRGTPLDSGDILFSRTHATSSPFNTPFNVAIIFA
jgi:hypothetical protein